MKGKGEDSNVLSKPLLETKTFYTQGRGEGVDLGGRHEATGEPGGSGNGTDALSNGLEPGPWGHR